MATQLAMHISQDALCCKTMFVKITGSPKKLNVEVPVGIYITNSLVFVPHLGAEKCISILTIREIYYLRIHRRYIILVLIILFALSIFVCDYFRVLFTNRIIWTSLSDAGGQRLNAGSSWGHSGCAPTESAASQTWPETEDSCKFILIRIQGVPIRIRIWSLSNMAYNRRFI